MNRLKVGRRCPELVEGLKVEGLRLFGSILFLILVGGCTSATATPTAVLPLTETPLPETATPTLIASPLGTARPVSTAPMTVTPLPTSENIPIIQFPAPGLIHDLRWAPDGNQLAIAVGTEIHLYDSSLVENRVIQLGIWTERLAFDPSNTLFGAALKDGSIHIWDWGSAKEDEVCKFTAHSKGANSLSFQKDGNLLATTGTDIISRMWDISLTTDGCQVKAVGQLIGSSFTAPDVSFSADGQKFALVDIKDIYLRESQTRKLIAVLHGDLAIFDIAFSPDGRWLAAAQNNNSVTLWDLSASPKPTSTLLQLPANSAKSYTWRVDFSAHDNLLAAATSDGEMLVWRLADLQPIFSRSLGHPIAGLAFNPLTSALTVGTLDGSVYMYAIK